MKKRLLLVAAAIVLVVLAAVLISVLHKDKKEIKSEKVAVTDACSVLSAADASKVLGSDASRQNIKLQTPKTPGITTTTCAYNAEKSKKTASVLLKTADSDTSAFLNKQGFESGKLQSKDGKQVQGVSQALPGVGEAAYYNKSFGQVQILTDSGKHWLTVQVLNGKNVDGDASVKLAKALAVHL